MENIEQKAAFLKNEYTPKLRMLRPDAQRLWGKMNVQQMIEHMSDYVRIGSGKTPSVVVHPPEIVERTRMFLVSETPFKENTPNKLLPDEPVAVRHANITDAISELQSELDDLFEIFNAEPGKMVTNPFFGELDYDMSVQLLHKHAWHHLRQFGINE